MPNLPQQDTIVQYYANGVTTQYIVPFYTPIEPGGMPDLNVYTQLSTATPVPEADINEWNVAYTYTPNIDIFTGGMITFNMGFIPPNGYIVTISRDVPASLDAEFSNAQDFSGITLDAALDRLLLISQQNKTYALERNLSYVINSYLPVDVLQANVQIPILPPGFVWMGATGGGVAAVLLNQSGDTSTLRSELANNAPVTNGASLVGYYDTVNMNPTNVSDQLTLLTESVEAAIPSGFMMDFGGNSAPSGWLVTDGASYAIATYPNLFAAIGYTWGGSGANFNVPNLQGFVTAGAGGTLPPVNNTVGSFGGSATHAILIAEMPAHNHPGSLGGVSTPIETLSSGVNPSLYGSGNTYVISIAAQGGGTLNVSGSPMTLVQPTAIVLKCIKT